MLDSWLSMFPLCHLTSLVVGVSDHLPISLSTSIVDKGYCKRRFKVENSWFNEVYFYSTVTHSWETSRG